MKPTLPLLGLVALSAACSTYSVRRSALAPHIAPPMRSGQGLGDATGEVSLGASSLASAGAPTEAEGANAGLYIPRVELVGALRARLGRHADIGLLWDHGFRDGAYATSEDQPSPENGSVYGGGLSMMAAIPAGERMTIGFAVDLLLYSVPYVEYRTCVTNCAGQPMTTVDHGRESIPVYSVALIPSYRTGNVALFGGVTLRNHPTVEKGDIETINFDEEVSAGNLNVVLQAGAEIDLGHAKALAMVYQPLSADPVAYPPTFALGLSVPFGRASSAPARAATAAPVAPPPAAPVYPPPAAPPPPPY